MKMKYSHIISKNFGKYRSQAKISRKKLAESTSIPEWKLGAIERGERVATIDELINIALAIEVPIVHLIYGEDPGLLDIRKHWPRNRKIITSLVWMLRDFERQVESGWVLYCQKVLEPYFRKLIAEGGSVTKGNAPKPIWRVDV